MCFFGLGFGPVFAAALIWTQENAEVTSKTMSLLTVAQAINMIPYIGGQIVETRPKLVTFLLLFLMISCILVFFTSVCIVKAFKRRKEEAEMSLLLNDSTHNQN